MHRLPYQQDEGQSFQPVLRGTSVPKRQATGGSVKRQLARHDKEGRANHVSEQEADLPYRRVVGGTLPTFQRNVVPPSSGPNSKPSEQFLQFLLTVSVRFHELGMWGRGAVQHRAVAATKLTQGSRPLQSPRDSNREHFCDSQWYPPVFLRISEQQFGFITLSSACY